MPDLKGRIAVGIVMVSGKGAELTEAVKAEMIGEATKGLLYLHNLEPRADIKFLVEFEDVELDKELVWTNDIAEIWPRWPATWDKVDAVLPNNSGKLYFFMGDEYLRYTIGDGVDAGYPKKISSAWSGWPPGWYSSGIDAAVNHSNGNFYFFKGDQYIRHVPGEGVDVNKYPKRIADTWTNWPASWTSVDAAMVRTDRESAVHFFKGTQHLRYITGGGDDGGVDDGYPVTYSGVGKRRLLFLPDEFRNGIDAVFQRDDGVVYLFKGRRYCRYPGFGYESTEKRWRDPAHRTLGVSAGLAGTKEYASRLKTQLSADAAIVTYITSYPVAWVGYADSSSRRHVMHQHVLGWVTPFSLVYAHETMHLFGATDEYGTSSCNARGGRNKVPNRNAKLCPGEQYECLMDTNFTTVCAWSRMQVGWNYGLAKIDAAIEVDSKRAYFFGGKQYVKYDPGVRAQAYPGYPRTTKWPGWPASWNKVDAAVDREDGKLYFFSGKHYIRYSTGAGVDDGYPRRISSAWSGWPSSWYESGIDAAVRHPNGAIYLFRGKEYIKHIVGEGVDASRYPKKIRDTWNGWPSGWDRIDAALHRSSNGKLYFFCGDEYLRYSPGEGVDSGYPNEIREWWGGLLKY